jgi:predicted glycoside hydrolase/deacetylase ChbG (UPF0249 family)
MTERKLIINADDFGMSQEVNEGIKKGIEAGMITSVSVMVNMPYFDDAIAYLKKHPDVSIGLHFNISEGSPISPTNKVGNLVREDGNFFYWTAIILSIFFRRLKLDEISTELTTQYALLKQTGLKISHIDSHHHIHLYPRIFQMVMKFAEKQNVKSIRYKAFHPARLLFWFKNPPTIKQFIIICMCLVDSIFFAKEGQLYEVNNLYDIAWNKRLNEKTFAKYLSSLPSGTTEIISHPAIMSKEGNRKFLESRQKGLNMLLSNSVKAAIRDAHIELVKKI